jgi:DNA (cytosine-5)-methyltransferase 1
MGKSRGNGGRSGKAAPRLSKSGFLKIDTVIPLREQSLSMTHRRVGAPVAVDLFCGAGGLSHGLADAGFHVALGVDFDPNALATFAANHTDAVTLCKDVTQLTADEVFRAAATDDIALVAGGPSCQGFSTHGKRIQDDPRNYLFKEFVRLVRETRPRCFLMENVKGLLAYDRGHYRTLIANAFEEAGYRVIYKVVCAADYGVPQLRHRIVFLGTRLDIPLSFPEPTHGPIETLLLGLKPYVTVGEAIGDLPLMRGQFDAEAWSYARKPGSEFQRYAREKVGSNLVTLHQANGVTKQAMRIVRHVAEGKGLRSVPLSKLPERFHKMRRISNGQLRRDCTTLYHRLARSSPAYTITCFFRNVSSGPFIHPLEDRSLSYREAARLMSFRDSFEFKNNSLARQIGNAVPPLLAKALGSHLLTLMGVKAHGRARRLASV